ncbi:UDP-2,3-diacylglucosamine diphosphatase [Legionella shakespearei]|uniref:UDP-2,3-diacylglucosamine hydrolase n=1 Tax=Legionella shakespearei DSM 23087 TaxID=1122169 RepID=A0A0W0Z0T9_9GAMM|nr:UDP-2,3-diacylglucosamine diphosphatase [Legionella shakespearei]KTD62747.1 UDP-2,3-diacylglucosamine hydrolase [Legionella shakespearei DSM 23087]
MIDAVFISDLHLHPDDEGILNRFNEFLSWAQGSVKSIYILGDFFHAWAGDDSLNDWSRSIALKLSNLKQQGISLYYMHGNRDFLLGKTFAKLAGWQVLADPTVITLGEERVLLSHGDRYCTKDISHQRFRLLTRNVLFTKLFLCLPLSFREKLVNKVRDISLSNHSKSMEEMDVVADAVMQHMKSHRLFTLIHGHTHKSGLTEYDNDPQKLQRFVLSDWDDTPKFLCYDRTKGIYFAQY